MKIIAQRSKVIGLLYFLTILGGCFILIFGVSIQEMYTILTGALITIIALIVLLFFAFTPKIAIEEDEKGFFHLSNGIVLSPDEIISSKYSRASSRGIQHKWGKLILKTKKGNFKYSFIKDVEVCSDYINKQLLSSNK